MSNSDSYAKRASAQDHPDAEQIGEHRVVREQQVVPGEHPEPHLRSEGQTSYIELYLKCVDCGIEVLRKQDLPETCESGMSR